MLCTCPVKVWNLIEFGMQLQCWFEPVASWRSSCPGPGPKKCMPKKKSGNDGNTPAAVGLACFVAGFGCAAAVSVSESDLKTGTLQHVTWNLVLGLAWYRFERMLNNK